MTTEAPAATKLPFTGNDDYDRLLASEPMALLIGFELDQQVTLQKAFSAPGELLDRIGTIDAAAIAAMDPQALDKAFRERPALHRFPGSMATKVQALAQHIVDDYGGDASRIWTEAADGKDLERRIAALPGFGEMKLRSLIAVLGKQLGVRPAGWEQVAPSYPTLGDVDSAEALADYQAKKRAYKQKLRESGESFRG
jgi:uncharacterized HhH-GPD family protein